VHNQRHRNHFDDASKLAPDGHRIPPRGMLTLNAIGKKATTPAASIVRGDLDIWKPAM